MLIVFLMTDFVDWILLDCLRLHCVCHIASNFNHNFKNGKQKEMLKKLGNIYYFIYNMLFFMQILLMWIINYVQDTPRVSIFFIEILINFVS